MYVYCHALTIHVLNFHSSYWHWHINTRVTRAQVYKKGFLHFVDVVINEGDAAALDETTVTRRHDQLQWCGIKIKVGCEKGRN